MDWYRSETWRAYERPESEVTGNKADDYERRAPGTAGMVEGVRYQVYETADHHHVLFMASEQVFWKNFCEGVDRLDLFERWPGSKYADHARGNRELRAELRTIFATKTAQEWLDFGGVVNTPIAPVNTPKTLLDDPQFADRLPLLPASEMGADQLFTPLHFVGEDLAHPAKAPTVGQHTEDVLRSVLDYDDNRIASARDGGAFGADA
jgi:crotonobetainyl-CoA:carnitine CoA-transferase CaiB-like acyl-CoA transferase